MGLQAQRPVLHRVRGEVLLGVHRLLHGARPDRAVDLPRHDHAHAGQQLHQPPRRHRLQRRLVLLLPQRRAAGRRRLHPLGRGGEVHLQRRRHDPDDQHDHRPGAPQVGTLNPYVRQEAETIAWESGVETEPSSEGGMNVGCIENGDYIKVKGVAFGTGATSFTARVASATSGGRIELRLDSATGTARRHLHRPGHRRLADLDDGHLPGQRRDRHPRPVPAVRRRQRLPVQRQLVAVHRRRRQRREPAHQRHHGERHDRLGRVRRRHAVVQHERRARRHPVAARSPAARRPGTAPART